MNQITTEGHRTAPWLEGAVRRVIDWVRHKLSYRIGRTIISAGNTIVRILQMSNLAFSEYNLVIIRLENVTLYLGQFLNSRISRSSCGTILSYTCISLVIQRLRRFCCSAIIFSIIILFLQFYFCFSISVSCGGAPQSYTYYIAVMPAFSLPLPRFSPEYRTAGR